uniref:Uncharacterized protein LOC100186044 n=1 Tax=Phallusia mammillata TaxID=59560 RepID=A0A6F9DIE2_9ASCI|nr:uncharacterized protein LOC100186044 [Phallusia mammillata]
MKILSKLRYFNVSLQNRVLCARTGQQPCFRNVQIQMNGLAFRPWINFQNMLFGVLIRGYFQQQFNLKEFMQFSPYALLSILEKLETKKFEELSELVENDCQKSILQNWESLSTTDKMELQKCEATDFYCFQPTLAMKIDVKQESELQAFLAINIKMTRLKHFMDNVQKTAEQVVNSKINVYIANDKLKVPTVYYFSFVREMTKGVDGAWKMVECKDWPKSS